MQVVQRIRAKIFRRSVPAAVVPQLKATGVDHHFDLVVADRKVVGEKTIECCTFVALLFLPR